MSGSYRRRLALLLLMAVAGCSGGGMTDSARQPSIRVAEEALRSGSPQIALQVSEGILSRDPKNVPALLAKGDSLTLLGRLGDATTALQEALKLEPGSVHGRISLGRIQLATDPAEAETLFQAVVAEQPRNANAWNNLGIAQDLLGRHREAQEAYRKVQAITNDMPAAQVNLALSLAMDGDTAGALRIIEPLATGQGATQKVRHDYAMILAFAGREAEAEEILSADMPAEAVKEALDVYRLQRRQALGTSAAPTPQPAARPERQPSSTNQRVQLGSYASEEAAKARWQSLLKKLPDLLAGHSPTTSVTAQNGKVRWRLVTDGFADPDAAKEFCGKVRATGTTCQLALNHGAHPNHRLATHGSARPKLAGRVAVAGWPG